MHDPQNDLIFNKCIISVADAKKNIQEILYKIDNDGDMVPEVVNGDIITNEEEVKEDKKQKLSKKDKELLMNRIEEEMKQAAKDLDFERAMELRDALFELKGEK